MRAGLIGIAAAAVAVLIMRLRRRRCSSQPPVRAVSGRAEPATRVAAAETPHRPVTPAVEFAALPQLHSDGLRRGSRTRSARRSSASSGSVPLVVVSDAGQERCPPARPCPRECPLDAATWRRQQHRRRCRPPPLCRGVEPPPSLLAPSSLPLATHRQAPSLQDLDDEMAIVMMRHLISRGLAKQRQAHPSPTCGASPHPLRARTGGPARDRRHPRARVRARAPHPRHARHARHARCARRSRIGR